MSAFLGSGTFWILLITGMGLLFFSPIIIGLLRGVEAMTVIVVLNLFPLLWPAALLMAFTLQPPGPRYPPAGNW